MHVRLRDTLISYMHIDLRWFYGIEPMVYDILVFNKLREMKYLIQAMIALKI